MLFRQPSPAAVNAEHVECSVLTCGHPKILCFFAADESQEISDDEVACPRCVMTGSSPQRCFPSQQ